MDAVRSITSATQWLPLPLRPLRGTAGAQAQGAVTTQGDAQAAPGPGSASGDAATTTTAGGAADQTAQGLTQADLQLLSTLQQVDAKVRAHEAAHEAAGGGLAGGVSFSYAVGPDGRTYAVGGEVPIEFRAGRSPQETIALAQQVLHAALAPADPSSQDLAVASAAQAIIGEAEALLALQLAQQRAAPAARAPQPAAADGQTGAAATQQQQVQDNPLAALALAAYRKAFPAAGASTSSLFA